MNSKCAWIDGSLTISLRESHPANTLVSEYAYNSLGQPTYVRTPDGDTIRYYYDYWGRLRFSQDQRQLDSGRYSYVRYDRLGRAVESGESDDSIASIGSLSLANNASFPTTGRERTYIVYSQPTGRTYLDGTGSRTFATGSARSTLTRDRARPTATVSTATSLGLRRISPGSRRPTM